jgi:tetratricopeptide (TPR) repeat protein
LVERGNELFRSGDFIHSIDLYNQVIESGEDMPLEEKGRALANRAQCYLNLGQYENVIRDCTQYLVQFDPKHLKSYFRRAKAYEHMGRHLEAYQDVLISMYYDPVNPMLFNLKRSIENNCGFMDFNEAIRIMTEICANYLRSTHQLKQIEHQKYHDIWQLEDYFDVMNPIRKFDVPCPPDLFIPESSIHLVEAETKYIEDMKNNMKTKRRSLDGPEYARIRALADFWTFDAQTNNLTFSLYYKFVQGKTRLIGYPNIMFAHCMLQALNNRKIFFLVPTENGLQLRVVSSVGLKCGYVRCRSTIWYSIAKGNVIARDYDPHVWLSIQLCDTTEQVTDEVDIDFVASPFNYFVYHRQSHYPLRIFSSALNEYEDTCSDYIGIYKVKKDKIFWNQEALNYINCKLHVKDYPITDVQTEMLLQEMNNGLYKSMANAGYL